MILPDAPWRARPGLDRLVEALDGAGGGVRFVGGAVRDTLLGLDVSDVDCATPFPPEEVVERAKAAGFRSVPTGIAHGTVTILLPDGPVEVTTLRRDVSTDGRRATVAFTDDWREDAARRDFTINALSADPLTGTVHDYFGGLADLEDRRVRFIGDPLTRIAEDHLRILRFFRFHARFGRGAPDPEGLAACAARANDLMALSRERIADELLKLLALPDPVPTVTLMEQAGLFRPVLPEIAAARLVHLPAREASSGIAPDPLRRLAALMPSDPVIAEDVAARLKLSNASRKRLAAVAGADSVLPPRALAHAIGPVAAVDALLIAGRDPAPIKDWTPPRLPMSGGELIAMGLRAGPQVAATLQAVERQWVAEDFPDGARVRAIARALADQAIGAPQA